MAHYAGVLNSRHFLILSRSAYNVMGDDEPQQASDSTGEIDR